MDKEGMRVHLDEAKIASEAALPHCVDHPTASYSGGFGLAGGGYGPYCICDECGRLFGKIEEPDDE